MSPESEAGLDEVGAHCPVCGTEYRPGFTHCADDGAEVASGPAAPTDVSADREPAEVDWWGRPADDSDREPSREPPAVIGAWPLQDALLMAGRLREEGIDAMAETDYEPVPGYAGFPHLVRVLVRADQAEDAQRIVREVVGS